MNGFVNQGEEFDQAAVVDRKPRAVARGGSRYENCWERLNVSQAELFLDLLKGGGQKINGQTEHERVAVVQAGTG